MASQQDLRSRAQKILPMLSTAILRGGLHSGADHATAVETTLHQIM